MNMAKVQFTLDSGANIHSAKKSGWLDTVDDLGLSEGEWEDMLTDDEKWEMAEEWAFQHLAITFEEKE
jgi:hypothetical protein